MNEKWQRPADLGAGCLPDAQIVRGLAVGWPEEQKEHVRLCVRCQERILEAWGAAGPHPVIEGQYRRDPEGSLYGMAIRRFWRKTASWTPLAQRWAAAEEYEPVEASCIRKWQGREVELILQQVVEGVLEVLLFGEQLPEQLYLRLGSSAVSDDIVEVILAAGPVFSGRVRLAGVVPEKDEAKIMGWLAEGTLQWTIAE
jgi:hypothetical protein